MLKNYLEFGSIQNRRKKVYEIKKGFLYDWYMLPRYFNDIYILDKFSKTKNFKKLSLNLHHKEDLRLNFVIFLLLKISKVKLFYEYGQTLFEKIYFLKIFSNFFKINFLQKIKWRGNDISEIFNFFCKNFYKNLNVKVFNNFSLKHVRNSTFFAKGVTLLYLRNNINILNKIIKNSKCGCFDISLVKKKKNINLNTGKILYFPTISEFLKLVNKSNKQFVFRNIKRDKKNKIYLEVIYGEKEIISKFSKEINFYNKKFRNNKNLIRLLGLNLKNHTDKIKSIMI
tara:strand:+ start:11397 stop:12248 length:852 start_codon:yes stop_codon:yes gene_type:complete